MSQFKALRNVSKSDFEIFFNLSELSYNLGYLKAVEMIAEGEETTDPPKCFTSIRGVAAASKLPFDVLDLDNPPQDKSVRYVEFVKCPDCTQLPCLVTELLEHGLTCGLQKKPFPRSKKCQGILYKLNKFLKPVPFNTASLISIVDQVSVIFDNPAIWIMLDSVHEYFENHSMGIDSEHGGKYHKFAGFQPMDASITTIFNAAVKDATGVDFFNADEGRYNLALHMGIDYAQLTRRSSASNSKVCPIVMTICNLPAPLRFEADFQMNAGIMNGPDMKENWDNLLEVLVEELLFLWYNGLSKINPHTKKQHFIKAALMCLILDHAARVKAAGTLSHQNAFGCMKCEFHAETVLTGGYRMNRKTGEPTQIPKSIMSWYTPPDVASTLVDIARTQERVLDQEKLYREATSFKAAEEQAKCTGIRCTIVNKLPYCNHVVLFPVDPMHLLLEGEAKHKAYERLLFIIVYHNHCL